MDASQKCGDHYKVEFTDGAIEAAVRLSDRYLAGRFLPDKAIDLLDEARSRARVGAATRPAEILALKEEIREITQHT